MKTNFKNPAQWATVAILALSSALAGSQTANAATPVPEAARVNYCSARAMHDVTNDQSYEDGWATFKASYLECIGVTSIGEANAEQPVVTDTVKAPVVATYMSVNVAANLMSTYWISDTESECHSDPSALHDFLLTNINSYKHVLWTNTTNVTQTYTLSQMGKKGASLVYAELNGTTATIGTTKLYRDKNGKFVAAYLTDHGNGFYLAYDKGIAIEVAPGSTIFQILLDDEFHPDKLLSYWGNPEMTQDCPDGVARNQKEQGMPRNQKYIP